jgi:hypothetical protein
MHRGGKNAWPFLVISSRAFVYCYLSRVCVYIASGDLRERVWILYWKGGEIEEDVGRQTRKASTHLNPDMHRWKRPKSTALTRGANPVCVVELN